MEEMVNDKSIKTGYLSDLLGESKNILIIFGVSFLIFKLAFYKESFYILFRFLITILLLYTIPGYALMFFHRKKVQFLDRLIFGTVLSFVIYGVFSFSIGIMGINVKYHIILIPLIQLVFAIFINLKYSDIRISSKSK